MFSTYFVMYAVFLLSIFSWCLASFFFHNIVLNFIIEVFISFAF